MLNKYLLKKVGCLCLTINELFKSKTVRPISASVVLITVHIWHADHDTWNSMTSTNTHTHTHTLLFRFDFQQSNHFLECFVSHFPVMVISKWASVWIHWCGCFWCIQLFCLWCECFHWHWWYLFVCERECVRLCTVEFMPLWPVRSWTP